MTATTVQFSECLLFGRYGLTSFIPTIGATRSGSDEKIKAVLKAMGRETGAQILGIHLEGRFIMPARIGGQLAEGISPVDLGLMERIYKAARGKIINMTVAPELKNMQGTGALLY